MNTEQLLGLVRELSNDEERLEIQEVLTNLSARIDELVGNPAHAPYHTNVADQLAVLTNELEHLRTTYGPGVWHRMEQIGATPYFSPALTARLRQSMADNPMTPAVVQQEIAALIKERAVFIERLSGVLEALDAFGFEEDAPEQGEAEIGFQIPRALFKNELDGFSKELHELRLIIRAFSEVADNRGEPIQLRQISTTDPLVFVAVSIYTAKQLAKGVEWCLHQWKTMEEIKVARATTASLKVASAQKLVEQFDAMMKESVQENTRSEAERLAAQATTDEARKNELKNHVGMALAGMLARIERGMTVEIRLAPPANLEKGAPPETDQQTRLREEFAETEEISAKLVFPAPVDDPLLHLEKQPEKTRRRGRGAAAP